MKIYILLVVSVISILIASCSKEEDAPVYAAPITILQPSTDPANIVKGGSIKYEVRFSNDEYIDSAWVSYQIDSFGLGYDNKRKDSIVNKAVYKTDRNNEKTLNGSFLPHAFPAVGKKIYLAVRMRSKNRNPEKILPLIVN